MTSTTHPNTERGLQATCIAFQEPYSDGSGTEYGVSCDLLAGEGRPVVTIKYWAETTEWPFDQIDWLIASLCGVRDALATPTEEQL